MEKLLVVEDAAEVRSRLRSVLGGEYAVIEGTDRADAMELFLRHFPRVVALDLGLPPDPEGNSEGMHCLDWMMQSRPSTKVVVLAAGDERETAYRALACGAYDFHLKPVVPAELQVVIRRAFQLSYLEEQSWRLKETLERTTAGIEGIAGQCLALQRLFSFRTAAVEPGREGRMAAGGAGDPPSGEGRGTPARLEPPGGHLTLREVRDRVEKRMVLDAVGNCDGNMSRASELLGVSRPALYDLMKKYGISRRALRG